MSNVVTLQPSGFQIHCNTDETILQAATRQGYRLRRSCDAGTCQLCEGRLLKGTVQLKHPKGTVSATEQHHPGVFCCLAIPTQSITIEVENVLAPGQLPTHEVSAQILSVDQVSSDVKVVQVRLPAGKKIEFYAGQYLEVLLPEDNNAAFSIASAPRTDRSLELHIRANSDSESYPFLEAQLSTGNALKLRLPSGTTTLHKLEQAQEIVFIAASTGFSQMKAMVEALIEAQDTRPLHIYWGARTAEDLYLDAQVRQLSHQHPHIHYTPVVSEQANWQGRSGMVHQAVLEDNNHFKDDVKGKQFVCGGSPAMVYAVFDDFIKAGMAPEQMISDVFDYAPRD